MSWISCTDVQHSCKRCEMWSRVFDTHDDNCRVAVTALSAVMSLFLETSRVEFTLSDKVEVVVVAVVAGAAAEQGEGVSLSLFLTSAPVAGDIVPIFCTVWLLQSVDENECLFTPYRYISIAQDNSCLVIRIIWKSGRWPDCRKNASGRLVVVQLSAPWWKCSQM